MGAIAVALGCSAVWGVADFLGGLQAKRFAVPVILAAMYVAALATLVVVVLLTGAGAPSSRPAVAALVAGLVGIVGIGCFYRGLAVGTMAVVAPIAATGVSIPVVAGLVGGDAPGVTGMIGLPLAVAGVVVAAREPSGGEPAAGHRASIVLALLAGAGIGTYLTLAEYAARDGVAWSLLLSRASAAPVVVVAALVVLRRGAERPHDARGWGLLALIGLLDLAANALFNHATTIGDLSTVSVASSLYPVVTVLLAAVLLGERIGGLQRAGVVAALSGVLLIAAGA